MPQAGESSRRHPKWAACQDRRGVFPQPFEVSSLPHPREPSCHHPKLATCHNQETPPAEPTQRRREVSSCHDPNLATTCHNWGILTAVIQSSQSIRGKFLA
jgi:hypothetical protein